MGRAESVQSVASIHRRGLYYGWYIVIACNVVAFMTWGVGVFNQGVFLAYFAEQHGWSRSDLSLGPTLFYVWAGAVGVGVGRLIRAKASDDDQAQASASSPGRATGRR